MQIPKFLKVLFNLIYSLERTPQTLEPAPEPATGLGPALPPGAVGLLYAYDPGSPTGLTVIGYCLKDPLAQSAKPAPQASTEA